MCITGEKSLQTIWDDLSLEFERITISEYLGGFNMDYSERSRNGSSPYVRRKETDSGRSKQGKDSETQILADETG
jgi:hypothetical protein